jgi:acyl-CoA synthetase (AMP-forming)/AMP-acid ligase II
LEKHGLTVLQTVPAVYFKLLSYFRESTTRSLPSLRYLHCGGSALDPTLKADVERALGLPLHNGYGLTETSPTIAQTRRLAPRTDCSVGEPVPGVEVRILPDGELCVRGPGVMLGYYLDDEKTREVLSPDGWFHTGDLAALGADGALHILGRKKDLIVRSGFNVYPSEVESALLRHPDVEAAAVVGVCEESNETVVAFVVRTSPSNACNEDLLRTFVSAFIAPYKRPSHVFFVDELPQTGSGKVRKHELVEMAHALLKAKEPRA